MGWMDKLKEMFGGGRSAGGTAERPSDAGAGMTTPPPTRSTAAPSEPTTGGSTGTAGDTGTREEPPTGV